MLETVIEIYVSFAVNSFSYNKANGSMLLEAVKDFQKGREGDLLEVLRKYYKEILSTIMKERV